MFCSYVHVCFVNYLEQHTVLYKVNRHNDDQHSPRVECRLLLSANEHARQLQHQHRRPVNIVISDVDTSNTCDRPLMKFLWRNCCEWNCSSASFRKLQVETNISIIPSHQLISVESYCYFYSRCICRFIYHYLYCLEYVIHGIGSTWTERNNGENISHRKLFFYGNIHYGSNLENHC